MIGEAPHAEEFGRQFDWPDAVIPVPRFSGCRLKRPHQPSGTAFEATQRDFRLRLSIETFCRYGRLCCPTDGGSRGTACLIFMT
jgi:hypothetical protein